MQYQISFEENGGEYVGFLWVTANEVTADKSNQKVFYADGIRVEIDEKIIEIKKL